MGFSRLFANSVLWNYALDALSTGSLRLLADAPLHKNLGKFPSPTYAQDGARVFPITFFLFRSQSLTRGGEGSTSRSASGRPTARLVGR